jgi:LysR family transcriptional regulator, regulator of abg operon
VEQGGIRAAARALHLSQAAVTKSMRLLEEAAATPLLIRRARGVMLTEAGQRLLARARVISRQVALAQEDLRQAAGDVGGTLRVGVTPFLTLTALGEAFSWFRQRYPNVELQLIEGLMLRVLPRLRDGTLDIAAVAADVGEIGDDEFNSRRLLRAPQRIVVREGHPVLADPSARALAALEWVLTQPIGGGTQPRIDAMFTLAGVAPPTRVICCETLAAMTILRHSDGVSIFPQPLLGHPETRGLVAIEACPLNPSDIELLLLTQPDVPLTPAAEYFAHCLASVCDQTVGVQGRGKRAARASSTKPPSA